MLDGLLRAGAFVAAATLGYAEIPKPIDAPPPLAPEVAAGRFQVPEGFRVQLVAAEPLIREPSGVCWDERGRLFVCELHGYNLEGQLDVEELNKTGRLDTEVRRIHADERFQEAAKAGTYGTLKLLRDADGDGRMDEAVVWADRIPPCYGICAARGGVVVACAPDVRFYADTDGDDRPDVEEVLFTGFETGALERGVSNPTMGLDGWIYFGRGRGGEVHGPKSPKPFKLPGTDFRIRPDGGGVEPVVGGTGTFGFAFTEMGERFVVSTRTPGIYVAPIEWRYLARNRDVASPPLEVDASSDARVYPISPPHPWRTRRAEDPGFSKFYTDRYGKEESAPNGYFTSACSPFVYQDAALPGLRGRLFACEPAQNLIHRAEIVRDGVVLKLRRAPGEENREFLASSDPWFHPIALAHGPDGAIWIVDFYREIIEDYSAIPRYLQQQYGVTNGDDRGRIWKLVHDAMDDRPPADMSGLTPTQLAAEVGSPTFWRRDTARRLLFERGGAAAAGTLARMLRKSTDPAVAVNALYALAGIGALGPSEVEFALTHSNPGVVVHGLRLAEPWLNDNLAIREAVLAQRSSDSAIVLLQLALSLGEWRDVGATAVLADLARKHNDVQWMGTAILSSLDGRCGRMLVELLASEDDLGKAASLVEPLCAAVAARRDPEELSAVLAAAAAAGRIVQMDCLKGLRSGIAKQADVALTEAGRGALTGLAASTDPDVRAASVPLIRLLGLESAASRETRLAKARADLADIQLPAAARLAAVAELAAEDDPAVASWLVEALPAATPRVREAILAALFAEQSRWPALLDAVEAKSVPAAAISAVQRAALQGHRDAALRKRAGRLLAAATSLDAEAFREYAAALAGPRDKVRGGAIFREKCASCHQAHGLGLAVGPDLSAEFLRAEETIIRDILAPSDSIAAGYGTYTVLTTDGRIVNGVLAAESAGSLTLRQAEGKEHVLLRKDVEELRAVPVSLMPEDLRKTVSPQDVADLIAWLRTPPTNLVLVDEDATFASLLDQGDGGAEFVSGDPFSGQAALRVSPPQRFSAKIQGWEFRIRENPGPGEYRYIRFAWKSDGARGVLIELADSGRWPDSDSPRMRYYAGDNTSGWQATQVGAAAPRDWTVVVRDLWADFSDATLTGIAPTAMGGAALFDRIELLQSPPDYSSAQ